jgi:hypothetical protein
VSDTVSSRRLAKGTSGTDTTRLASLLPFREAVESL